jgi:hypothetical protein
LQTIISHSESNHAEGDADQPTNQMKLLIERDCILDALSYAVAKEHVRELTQRLAREKWRKQWQFARLMEQKWYSTSSPITDNPKALAIRKQAPHAFACLIARRNDAIWEVWQGIQWHHFRPGKHLPPRPLP